MLFFGERGGGHCGQTEIVVALIKSGRRNAIQLELANDFLKRFLVGNAYQNNRRRNKIGALGERLCHFKCGVIGLDNLRGKGDVLPDEQEAVWIHLMHGRYYNRSSEIVKPCFSTPASLLRVLLPGGPPSGNASRSASPQCAHNFPCRTLR